MTSNFQPPPPDVQAILTVIGRRKLTYGEGEDHRLDLIRTDMSRAELMGDLSGAILSEADLREH